MVLSIDMDKTNEEDLFNAVNRAKLILDSSYIMLIDFTSYADISIIPGHYMVYWEVIDKQEDKKKKKKKHMELNQETFVTCSISLR